MDMLVLEGFDEAEIGVCTTWHGDQLVERIVYDAHMVVEIIVLKQGLTPEEATDYVESEFVFKYAGDTQPILVWTTSIESDEDQ